MIESDARYFAPDTDARQAARPHLLAALGRAGRAEVEAFLAACPRAEPTPLVSLPGLARALGIESLHVKDEGRRLGLGSFKALGGAYAALRLILDHARDRLGCALDPCDLATPEVRPIAASLTLCCATDGNHGRSVAAGARIAGARCIVFVHPGVSHDRAQAIEAHGAEVRRTSGTYDESVLEAAEIAAREGWTVVSDTSRGGGEIIPLAVMQGYTVMAGEAFDELAEPPSHVFLQAGVGGMAAAVAAHSDAVYGLRRPRAVLVEPARAACLFASAQAGRLVEIPHGVPTVMGMLECYAPSPVAWEVLAQLASGYVVVDEHEAVAAMNRLATPEPGDRPVVSGESGAAGLAGLMACLEDRRARDALALHSNSRVLLINSEGATDPKLYARLVGRTPEAVLGERVRLDQSEFRSCPAPIGEKAEQSASKTQLSPSRTI